MKFVFIFPCFAVMATGLLSAVAQADEPSAKLRGFTEGEHRMLTALTGSDLGGRELNLETAGTTFTSTGGMVMSATLTLVLPSDYDSTISIHPVRFQLAGPFVTAASTKVVFRTAGSTIEYGTDDANGDPSDPTMRTEFLRLASSVNWDLSPGAVTLGADSVVAGNIDTTAGVMTLGAGAVVAGSMTTGLGAVGLGANAKSGSITTTAGAVALGANAKCGPITAMAGAVALGADAEVDGNIDATAGAITLGANAKTGDILATAGAITLGAGAETGSLVSTAAAITIAAGAIANGNVEAGFAITFGAGGIAKGLVKAGAAITFGAGSGSCGYCSAAATTLGAGYNMGVLGPFTGDCTGVTFVTPGAPGVCSSGGIAISSVACGVSACSYPAA